ncbi:MAG TPA: flavin reductase family protein [Cyclobacteriaceae bacterium]|nr:flavin reductase family protein [Cyclobacteriaceae bacterium]
MIIDPKDLSIQKRHAMLQGAVIPRPISFASTVDNDGNVNLSPFSFFNMFSSNPPTLIFSPSRRGRDNTTKHTYENVKQVPEVVINIVNYSMVEQASLASCDFPKSVNEFAKAGFTPVPSVKVKPPRVAESPVSFECKVNQVIELGYEGAAGNLVICEVLLMHVKDEMLDENGNISPYKLDAVARLGQDYYTRVSGDSIFVVPKPNEKVGMGFDAIPDAIRKDPRFTMNDLGRLGNVEKLPAPDEVRMFSLKPDVQYAITSGEIHDLALKLLRSGNVADAWKALLI